MVPQAIVWTEGITDVYHLRHFLDLSNPTLAIEFKEVAQGLGADELLRQCIASSRQAQPCPTIFIFDNDRKDIVSSISDPSGAAKDWGNNTFSFPLPVPAHRSKEDGICIELYYTDDELRVCDKNGRRLYLSTEFNPQSGRHRVDNNLSIGSKGKIQPDKSRAIRIIDSDVYNEANLNVALSKVDFAKQLVCQQGCFDDRGTQRFNPVFEMIAGLIQTSLPEAQLLFGGATAFLEEGNSKAIQDTFRDTLDSAINIAKLVCMIYIATTMRYYDLRLRSEDRADRRRTKPIKGILADSFLHPSLSTLQKLSTSVNHLIDADAPRELLALRSMMLGVYELGPLGSFLDLLDKCFPTSLKRGRTINKQALHKSLLEFILVDLAHHEGHLSQLKASNETDSIVESEIDHTWKNALPHFMEMLSPLHDLVIQQREPLRVSTSDSLKWLVSRFQGGRYAQTQSSSLLQPSVSTDLPITELEVHDNDARRYLDLWPFLICRNKQLYYFARKTITGFEYAAPFVRSLHEIETNRSFYRAALQLNTASDAQSLFWAHIEPSLSATGVRANLPHQDPIVGRKQQLNDIIQDVLIIPLEHAILYGPGGVGKTALLLELARYLYEDPAPAVHYDNVIWISAKQDYYDPVFDTVEKRPQRITSLESVFAAILEFHGVEDSSDYPLESMQWYVTELFLEQPTLVVIDNFETIPANDQEQILRFFGTELKRSLRTKPANGKVLITSRETVRSGFHQIQLRGLDWDESLELMHRLYTPYVHSGRTMLTEDQAKDLYDATSGIPLLLKHAFGQIYEYHQDLAAVVAGLTSAGNNVIAFSFSEIIARLKTEPIHLSLLIVLELAGRPLLSRHISEIMEIHEDELIDYRDRLVRFHCIFQSTSGQYSKYEIADEAHLLAKRLTYEHKSVTNEIKLRLSRLAMDQMRDFSTDEYEAHLDFRKYVEEGSLLSAEDFIRDYLKSNPESLLLNCDYAQYLHEIKKRTQEAIDRLEGIRAKVGNEHHILRALMTYYAELPVPDFTQGNIFARELEDAAIEDPAVRADLARFYIGWATSIKIINELDPIKRIEKTQQYKELSDAVLRLLPGSDCTVHEKYFLSARAYYNKWDYARAAKDIELAMQHLPLSSGLVDNYRRVKQEIAKKQNERELWRKELH